MKTKIKMVASLLSLMASGVAAQTNNSNVESNSHPATEIFRRQEQNGKAIYTADDVSIPANQQIVFGEPATVYVKSLEMMDGSSLKTSGNSIKLMVEEKMDSNNGAIDVSYSENVNTSGANGPNGPDGSKAGDALKGADGGAGTDGVSGGSGGDATSISIMTPYLRGNVTLIARGGNGGNGGAGGNGGNGGKGLSGDDARTLFNFKGLGNFSNDALIQLGTSIGVPVVGQVLAILQIFNGMKIGNGFDGFDGGSGGKGGNGGDGGNGGNGGNITLVYGLQVNGTKIDIDAQGGAGGAAGHSGVGGMSGEGGEGGLRGDFWSIDGKHGNAGKLGLNGANGKVGAPGKSGQFKHTETDDPNFVACFIKYRQMVDFGEDASTSQDFLNKCIAKQ